MKKFKILCSVMMVAMTFGFSTYQPEEILPEQAVLAETANAVEYSNSVPTGFLILTDMPAGYESCFKNVEYLGYCIGHIEEKEYYIKNDKEGIATSFIAVFDDQYSFFLESSKRLYPSGEYLVPYSISSNASSVIMPVDGGYCMYTLPRHSEVVNIVFTIHYKVMK